MREYLNNLPTKEIIERLLAGKIAKNDLGRTLYAINGVLCSSIPNEKTVIGACVGVSDFENLYFEEPEKLKIEVGKCYKTRDGRKAFISAIRNSNDVFFGCIQGDFDRTAWHSNGLFMMNETSDYDLISEWSDEDVAKDWEIAKDDV